MAVINGAVLQLKRVQELQRRRREAVAARERKRSGLPDWALASLKMAGLSQSELRALVEEVDEAERGVGLGELDRQIEALDRQIEEAEDALLQAPSATPEGLRAVLELALARASEGTPNDPGHVMYDHGQARTVRLIERALRDVEAWTVQPERRVG